MIINLTQHPGTSEQGVFDLEGRDLDKLKSLLTFESLPEEGEIRERANDIAILARTYAPDAAMIGGAPYLMAKLERALRKRGIKPLYAFSIRESIEEAIGGKIVKRACFKHVGFVAS